MIRTNPFPVKWQDITNASLYLGKPYKQLEEVAEHTKFILSTLDTRWLENKAKKIHIDYLDINIYLYEDTVYIPSNIPNDAIATLVIAYCTLEYKGNESNINKHYNHYRSIEDTYININSYVQHINSYHNNIRLKYSSISRFQMPDYKELLKSAKRMKIKVQINDDGFVLDMGKCECGNEIEGYIKYKTIILWFDTDWCLRRVQFHFSDWIMDTNWSLHTHIHPHISSSRTICYGNRLEDFEAYRAGNNFPFLLDLIKETCNSYSPERPYNSVKQIAKELIAIKAALPKFIKTNPEYSDEEAKSKMLLRFMRQHRRTCPSCNSYMIGDECTNDNCVRNPLAEIHCATCNSVLTWDETNCILLCPNLANHNQPVPAQPNNTRPTEMIIDDPDTGTDDLLDALGYVNTQTSPIQPSEPRCSICNNTLQTGERMNGELTQGLNPSSRFIGTIQPAGYFCNNHECELRFITQYSPERTRIELVTNEH